MSRSTKLQKYQHFCSKIAKDRFEKRVKLKERIKLLMVQKSEFSQGKGKHDIESIEQELIKVMMLLNRTSLHSYVKSKRVCLITGRARGVKRLFNSSRHVIRHYASMGYIAGLRKV